MKVESFIPPLRTLMGPGPSDINPRVLAAMARPTIGHLDPRFIELMDSIKELLKYAFKTQNEVTFPISGPGSAGMEACFANLVEEGDKVLVCINGVFGQRMYENVLRNGGVPIVIEDSWGEPIDLNKVEDALKKDDDIKIISFVHAETSTGVLSDAKALGQIAKDKIIIADTVTSLAGSPLYVDQWGLDAVYSGSQKCLSAPPGLSPVSFSEKALSKIKTRKSKVKSWFLDLNLVLNYWSGDQARSYHHTAPINSLYALHESLVLLKEEGLENAWKRHHDLSSYLENQLKGLGFEYLVHPDYRTPQLNAVTIPEKIKDKLFREILLNQYNIEIGAGLGPLAGSIFRIGLMGASCTYKNIDYLINAIKRISINY